MTKRELERAINIITAYYQMAKADMNAAEIQAFKVAIDALYDIEWRTVWDDEPGEIK